MRLIIKMEQSTVEFLKRRGYSVVQDIDEWIELSRGRRVRSCSCEALTQLVRTDLSLMRLRIRFVRVTYKTRWSARQNKRLYITTVMYIEEDPRKAAGVLL